MKTSKKILLLTVLTGSTFFLTGCEEEKRQDLSFASEQACMDNRPAKEDLESWETMCAESYKNALAAHEKEAPHYTGTDAKALCEEQHGVGKCYSPAEIAKEDGTVTPPPDKTAGDSAAASTTTTSASSGNWFMPFMAGWMVSSLFNDSGRTYYQSQAKPLYSSASGGYTNSNGYKFNSLNTTKRATLNNTSYTKSTPTTYTRSTVRSTGGFGASRTSSSSSRSYGG